MNVIDKLKELCSKATPGNWFVAGPTHLVIATRLQPDPHNGKRIATTIVEDVGGKVQAEYNAAFIACARTALPALIEYVEALEWKRECWEMLHLHNQKPVGPRSYTIWGSIDMICVTATAAVEAARAKLEECVAR